MRWVLECVFIFPMLCILLRYNLTTNIIYYGSNFFDELLLLNSVREWGYISGVEFFNAIQLSLIWLNSQHYIQSRILVLASDFSKVCRDDSHFAVKKCSQQASKHPFTVITKKGNILWPTHHTCVWVRTTPHLWLTWGANFLFFTPAGIGWLSSTQIHQPYWFPLKWGKWRNLTRTLHTILNSQSRLQTKD